MHTLTGRKVIVTRERRGELDDLLTARGAEVVHVPLIGVGDPADGGDALRGELSRIDTFDWLVVTSPEGARRVGAATANSEVRLAAVGTATARTLEETSGRAVAVVPSTQRAEALAAAIVAASTAGTKGVRALVAQADLADDALGAALRAAGIGVVEVTAYATSIADGATAQDAEPVAQAESIAQAESVADADAVLFASGSAVRGWVAVFGRSAPPVVVVIGPSTGAVATELGLDIAGTAADHSLVGLVAELEAHLG